MALDLVEISPSEATPDVGALSARATVAASDVGSAVVEAVWAAGPARLYLIVDGGARAPSVAREALLARLRAAELPVKEVATVRLVGPPAAEATGKPSHLVEWDLPADLGMERYLKRKAEKTPLYAQVPEVKFLRTYVREDTVKCLCLYEAPDDDAVRRARAIVSAPITRLAQVESLETDAASTRPSAPAVTRSEGT